MATFKKQKKFVPGAARAAAAAPAAVQQAALSDALGFDDEPESDEQPDDVEQDGSEEGKDEDEGDGFSFIEYLTLQKSLRKVTDQKIVLGDKYKVRHDMDGAPAGMELRGGCERGVAPREIG